MRGKQTRRLLVPVLLEEISVEILDCSDATASLRVLLKLIQMPLFAYLLAVVVAEWSYFGLVAAAGVMVEVLVLCDHADCHQVRQT